MEYGWKCFAEQRFIIKSRHCKVTLIVSYIVLMTVLTLSVAVYSYAGEQPEFAPGSKLPINSGLTEGYDIGLKEEVTAFSAACNPDTKQRERL